MPIIIIHGLHERSTYGHFIFAKIAKIKKKRRGMGHAVIKFSRSSAIGTARAAYS
jgi:hypothetical protein